MPVMPIVNAILLLALLVGLAMAAPEEEARVSLHSHYLTEPLGGARQIHIEGVLGGEARIVLDPNSCTLNEFGDPEACTEMAALPRDVRLLQAKLTDPAGKGRRLYALSGPVLEGRELFLVVPRGASDAYRLIVRKGKAIERMVSLVARDVPKQPPPPSNLPLCRFETTYTATQAHGRVVLRASGEAGSPGWTIRFEQEPQRIWPPQFRLVCERPKGMQPQVMTPFRVERSFKANNRVDTLRVRDARGTHEVRVSHP